MSRKASGEPDSANPFIIKGKVFYKDGDADLPLPGAAVQLKGTKTGATTDKNGDFQISLPSLPKQPAIAKVLFIGYKPLQIALDFTSSQTLDVGLLYMQEDQALMGEVVIVRSNPAKALWWKIRNLFQ